MYCMFYFQNLADNKGAFDKEDSLSNLCNALVANRTIVELNLSRNQIQDQCATALKYLLQVTAFSVINSTITCA